MKGGEELDDLDRYFAALPAILADPSQRYRYKYLYRGRWRHALPLPWNTRLRLWCKHKRDGLAIRLCDHGHFDAAEAVWRWTGAWRKR